MTEASQVPCPRCNATLTIDHIRENPECDAYIASLCARRSTSKRESAGRNGGRPPVIVKCPSCGKKEGKVAMLSHVCKRKLKKENR